jgi:hypothetical protein
MLLQHAGTSFHNNIVTDVSRINLEQMAHVVWRSLESYWNGFIQDQLSEVYNCFSIYKILLLLLLLPLSSSSATYEPHRELLKCNGNSSKFKFFCFCLARESNLHFDSHYRDMNGRLKRLCELKDVDFVAAVTSKVNNSSVYTTEVYGENGSTATAIPVVSTGLW